MELARLITSDQPLVFRDGRPFGDAGMRGMHAYRWPAPSTVAGAFRTAAGRARSPDYFAQGNPDLQRNLARIAKLSLSAMLPVRQRSGETWEFLAPRPADAIAVAVERDPGRLDILAITLRTMPKGAGSDLELPDWLHPFPPTQLKPSPHAPAFWTWAVFEEWLRTGASLRCISADELGTHGPVVEERMHVGIDAEAGVAQQNALFASCGILLRSMQGDPLGLAVVVGGDAEGMEVVRNLYLGGERRMAEVAPLPMPLPSCPSLSESAFLRLVLLTPGDFGGWCPQTLGSSQGWSRPWKDFPTDIRLRSAIIPPWTPLSGWDFASRGPKATRKLVPPGAIYVVELRDPAKTQEAAQALWLRSLCAEDSQAARDGFGIMAVGRCAPVL